MEFNKPKQKEWDNLQSLDSVNTVFEPKRDGVRLAIVSGWTDEVIACYTKSYKYKISKFPELISDLQNFFPKQTPVVLDGELVTETVNGDYFSNTSSRVLMDESKSRIYSKVHARQLTYVVFDIRQYGDENLENSPLSYRRELLEKMFQARVPTGRLKLIERLENKNDVTKEYCFENNLEGIVVKDNTKPYMSNWYKIKAYYDDIFKIVSVREGKRDYIMTLSNDEDETVGDCTLFATNVPVPTIGIDPEHRWNILDTLVGRKVDVSYMKGPHKKLRFPVFKRFIDNGNN
jgi:ATP-dependent DNA ligase